MREAKHEKVENIEERPKGLNIERIIEEKGRNSKLLWYDRYRKITQDNEENTQTAWPDSQGRK